MRNGCLHRALQRRLEGVQGRGVSTQGWSEVAGRGECGADPFTVSSVSGQAGSRLIAVAPCWV